MDEETWKLALGAICERNDMAKERDIARLKLGIAVEALNAILSIPQTYNNANYYVNAEWGIAYKAKEAINKIDKDFK